MMIVTERRYVVVPELCVKVEQHQAGLPSVGIHLIGHHRFLTIPEAEDLIAAVRRAITDATTGAVR